MLMLQCCLASSGFLSIDKMHLYANFVCSDLDCIGRLGQETHRQMGVYILVKKNIIMH